MTVELVAAAALLVAATGVAAWLWRKPRCAPGGAAPPSTTDEDFARAGFRPYRDSDSPAAS